MGMLKTAARVSLQFRQELVAVLESADGFQSGSRAATVRGALPLAGNVGRAVKILGQGLTGTTSVSFNRTTSSFTVPDTYVSAAVPGGATTGYITVNTPSGCLQGRLLVYSAQPERSVVTPVERNPT
jgi:hypothetical protein